MCTFISILIYHIVYNSFRTLPAYSDLKYSCTLKETFAQCRIFLEGTLFANVAVTLGIFFVV